MATFEEQLKQKAIDDLHGLRKRVFTVAGPHTVFGKHKGETVEAELTDEQADALILGGHVVEKSATKAVVLEPAEEAPHTEAVTHVEDMAVVKLPGAVTSAQDKK
jgi:hypothetical protein